MTKVPNCDTGRKPYKTKKEAEDVAVEAGLSRRDVTRCDRCKFWHAMVRTRRSRRR